MQTGSRKIEVTTNLSLGKEKPAPTGELTATARKATNAAMEASKQVSQGNGTHSTACNAHDDAAIEWSKLADVQSQGMKAGGKLAKAKMDYHTKMAAYHRKQGGMAEQEGGNAGQDATSQGRRPTGKKDDNRKANRSKLSRNGSGLCAGSRQIEVTT